MKETRIRILLEGQWQGLNFRLATQAQAQQLQLVGFVRLLSDGRIEIEAQGPSDQVDALLTWCQAEPHGERIHSILYRHDDPLEGLTEFSVRT